MIVWIAILLGSLFAGLTALPCYLDSTPPCTVCTKWEDTRSGDLLCKEDPETQHVECEMLQTNDKMCLEEQEYDQKTMACTRVYRWNETLTLKCNDILNLFNLDIRELIELNNNDKQICEKMEERHDVCIVGIHNCPKVKMEEDYPLCVGQTCKLNHVLANHMESCEKIVEKYEVKTEHLYWNNPNLTCDDLPLTGSVCIWREGQRIPSKPNKGCKMEIPMETYTCEIFASRHGLSFSTFMEINPLLRCDALTSETKACVGDGYFRQGMCTDFVVSSDVLNSCKKIQRHVFGDNPSEMGRLNGQLYCDRFSSEMLVCARNSGNFVPVLTLVNEMKLYSSILQNAHYLYSENRTTENERNLQVVLIRELTKISLTNRLEAAFDKKTAIRNAVDTLMEHIDRKKACSSFKNLPVFGHLSHIADCLCGEQFLLFTCAVFLFEEWETLQKKKRMYETKNLPSFATTECFIGPDDNHKREGGCALPGCKVEYSIFSIHLDTLLCWPEHKVALNQSTKCLEYTECFGQNSIETTVQLCSTDPVLQFAFGGTPCLSIAGVYNRLLGTLRIHSLIFSNFFKIEVRLSFKVNEMHNEVLHDCDRADARCQDFCVWRNEKAWKFSGFVGAYLEFGVMKFPLFEHLVPFPFDDCAANKAVVIIENQRTKNSELSIRCWSNDNDLEYFMNETSIPYTGKHTVPMKVSDGTVITCRLRDGLVNDIAIDVYGGDYAFEGRKLHTFRVNAKTIEYIPEDEKDKIKRIAIWD